MPIYHLHLLCLLVFILKLSSSTVIKVEEHAEAAEASIDYDVYSEFCGNITNGTSYCFGAPLGCIENKSCDNFFSYYVQNSKISIFIFTKNDSENVFTAAALSTRNDSMAKSLLTMYTVDSTYSEFIASMSYGYINEKGGNITTEVMLPPDSFSPIGPHEYNEYFYLCALSFDSTNPTYTYEGVTYSLMNTSYYLALYTGTYGGIPTLLAIDDKPTIFIPIPDPITTTTTASPSSSTGSPSSSPSHEVTTASYISTSTKGHGSSSTRPQSVFIFPFLVLLIVKLL